VVLRNSALVAQKTIPLSFLKAFLHNQSAVFLLADQKAALAALARKKNKSLLAFFTPLLCFMMLQLLPPHNISC